MTIETWDRSNLVMKSLLVVFFLSQPKYTLMCGLQIIFHNFNIASSNNTIFGRNNKAQIQKKCHKISLLKMFKCWGGISHHHCKNQGMLSPNLVITLPFFWRGGGRGGGGEGGGYIFVLQGYWIINMWGIFRKGGEYPTEIELLVFNNKSWLLCRRRVRDTSVEQ